MQDSETLDDFVERKRKELQAFADWYRKQQNSNTIKEDYPDIQRAAEWEDEFLHYLPDLS